VLPADRIPSAASASAPPVYVALLHHPVVNRQGVTVTTSVTNMDIHDISRTCRTYGIKKFFIVTPIDDQQELVGRILKHWSTEDSKRYHPDRVSAVSRVELVRDFAAVKGLIRSETGQAPRVWMPDARPLANSISYSSARAEIGQDPRPVVVVFGTGWGLAEEFLTEVDRVLAPIQGRAVAADEPYNHLSVRAAAAIVLDRLLGE
jgi:hypothetical protein